MAIVKTDVIAFLLGKAPYMGVWFEEAESNHGMVNKYWWRQFLANGVAVSGLDLDELLNTQAALQARMGHPTGVGEPGLKENLLHVIVEACEAMAETNFKPWKTTTKPVDRQALATELTDILQFWANAALAMDLTPEDLTDALRAKWVENGRRIDSGEVVELSTTEVDNEQHF